MCRVSAHLFLKDGILCFIISIVSCLCESLITTITTGDQRNCFRIFDLCFLLSLWHAIIKGVPYSKKYVTRMLALCYWYRLKVIGIIWQ